MKSVKRFFEKVQAKNPFWSSYTCFAEAVMQRRLTEKTIKKEFNELVDKDDYDKKDKKAILKHLFRIRKK